MMKQQILQQVEEILELRKQASTDASYTASLYAAGTDAILKKIGEEATEIILAVKSGEAEAIVHEVADLWFHCMLLLVQQHLSTEQVLVELERRFGVSGHVEKEKRSRGH